MKIVWLAIASVFAIGCTEDLKEIVKDTNEIGQNDIRYYADKTVTSLEVPPDLTQPNIKDRINLNAVIDTSQTLVTFEEPAQSGVVRKIQNKDITIEVKRNPYQNYLVINKDASYALHEAKNFLKANGFTIENENTELGILETNFLENKEILPNSVLNPIRSLFQSTLGAQYSLPTIDKYRVRVESSTPNISEVYLSLNSMQKVVINAGASSENTIWQAKSHDEFVETQMLYQLMVFMGSDDTAAKQQIINAVEQSTIKPVKKIDINGFAKLQLNASKEASWEAIAFAIDKLGIAIEDRDKRDGSFYISVANDEERGILSSIFSDDVILQSFRIRIKELEPDFSEVYFIDLSGENEESTKAFSHTLLERITNIF